MRAAFSPGLGLATSLLAEIKITKSRKDKLICEYITLKFVKIEVDTASLP